MAAGSHQFPQAGEKTLRLTQTADQVTGNNGVKSAEVSRQALRVTLHEAHPRALDIRWYRRHGTHRKPAFQRVAVVIQAALAQAVGNLDKRVGVINRDDFRAVPGKLESTAANRAPYLQHTGGRGQTGSDTGVTDTAQRKPKCLARPKRIGHHLIIPAVVQQQVLGKQFVGFVRGGHTPIFRKTGHTGKPQGGAIRRNFPPQKQSAASPLAAAPHRSKGWTNGGKTGFVYRFAHNLRPTPPTMPTLLEILQKTTAYLAGKGVPNPKLNAELLLAHVLRLRRLDLYLQFDRPLHTDELDALRPLVQRRGRREPLEYIIGNRPFVDIELLCDRRALVPRSETEELVELLAKYFDANADTAAKTDENSAPARPAPPRRVLDLGTGTGALALALAKLWPQASICAVDASAEALELARANAAHNNLSDRITFAAANWFTPLTDTAPAAVAIPAAAPAAPANSATLCPPLSSVFTGGAFDLIVSNPPYLTHAEWEVADPEVKDYEPYGALVATEDGLADLRAILCAAPAFLAPGGLLALETGIAHHEALAQIAAATQAYTHTESHRDSDARPRFFLARS